MSVEFFKDCGPVSIKMNRGIFIVASTSDGSNSAAVSLGENDQNLLQEGLRTLIGAFALNSLLEYKLIGTRSLVSVCDELLLRRRSRVSKAVFREAPCDLIYNSEDGKTRVSKEKTRVLIADDSSTIRRLLERLLASDPDIEVVASAALPSQVEDLIIKHRPHVITLDLHMPEMNGVTLLKKILPKYLIPTVIISSISMEEGPMVLEALENGAVDYIQKPSVDQLDQLGPMILEKIKAAALVKVKSRGLTTATQGRTGNFTNHSGLIAIGSSTGGTEALKEILTRLPAHIPAIVITQHIPPGFSRAFAERMNQLCPFEVKEAEDGDEICPDRVLIGAGGTQFTITRKKGKLFAQVTDEPPVNRHKPSVDVLFKSVSVLSANNAICVILTGMGADGAKGLLECRNAGARTIAQDEESCVVFGMPREAIRLGGAEKVCTLLDIPEELRKLSNRQKVA